LALHEVNPHLMTIGVNIWFLSKSNLKPLRLLDKINFYIPATLTGHVCLALGTYTAIMDNGPAKAVRSAHLLQEAGDTLGDMIEVSTIRREDYKFVKSEDITAY